MVVFDEDPPPTLAQPSRPQSVDELDYLLQQIGDYTPCIPDAVTVKYLERAGMTNVDPKIVRIMAVAAQKLVSDIANDSLQHCKTRTNNMSGSHGATSKDKKLIKDRKYAVATEDLQPALVDHGLKVRKPQYFV